MSENDEKKVVKDDMVVSIDYTLRVDGGIVDSSENGEPLQFIQGQGQIIPGLENELYGMAVGDSKEVTVQPEEGYGQMDQNAYARISKSEFPKNIPLQPGVALQLRDEEGNILDAYIVSIEDDVVRLDFNHPLAGKVLDFNVEVVDLRDASEEELSHGHVHADDHGEEPEEEDWEEGEEVEIEIEEEEDWEEEEDEDQDLDEEAWEEEEDWEEDEDWDEDEDWEDDDWDDDDDDDDRY